MPIYFKGILFLRPSSGCGARPTGVIRAGSPAPQNFKFHLLVLRGCSHWRLKFLFKKLRKKQIGMWRSPVSVHVWGACGRGFKSRHPDSKSPSALAAGLFLFGANRACLSEQANKKGQRAATGSDGLWRRVSGIDRTQ